MYVFPYVHIIAIFLDCWPYKQTDPVHCRDDDVRPARR